MPCEVFLSKTFSQRTPLFQIPIWLNAKSVYFLLKITCFYRLTEITPEPTVGWDFETTGGVNTETRYEIDTPLQTGNYISITLAWDRIVEFDNDQGAADRYDVHDTFEAYGADKLEDVVNDLGIFLVEQGEDFSEAFSLNAYSDGEVEQGTGYNLEHLFYEIPTTGEYDIVIPHFDDSKAMPLPPQDYALAWWYGLAPALPTSVAGDFNGDGNVNAADLVQWQGDFGINGESDADNDGDSDGADFLAWQRNFGVTALASSTAVPEPATWLLLSIGFCVVPHRYRSASRNNVLIS